MAHGTNSTNYITAATNVDLIAGIYSGFFEIVRIIEKTLDSPDLNTPGAWGEATSSIPVPHGLGATPIVIASAEIEGIDNFVSIPSTRPSVFSGSPYWIRWSAYADDINITFQIIVVGNDIHVTPSNYFFRAYLLRQKATSALS